MCTYQTHTYTYTYTYTKLLLCFALLIINIIIMCCCCFCSCCTHILHPICFPSLFGSQFRPSCADCVDVKGYHIQPTEMKIIICIPSKWYDGTRRKYRIDKWRKHRISWICIWTKALFIVFSTKFRYHQHSTSKRLHRTDAYGKFVDVRFQSYSIWNFRSNLKKL